MLKDPCNHLMGTHHSKQKESGVYRSEILCLQQNFLLVICHTDQYFFWISCCCPQNLLSEEEPELKLWQMRARGEECLCEVVEVHLDPGFQVRRKPYPSL